MYIFQLRCNFISLFIASLSAHEIVGKTAWYSKKKKKKKRALEIEFSNLSANLSTPNYHQGSSGKIV